MSVMTKFQNRLTRIVVIFPPEKKLKSQIYTRRTRKEVLELFDGLVMAHGEVAILQSYLEDHGWVDQETKRLMPKKQLI